MIAPVPPPDLPGVFPVTSRQGAGENPQQGCYSGGQIVDHIVQLSRSPAKIQVLFIFISHHAIHGVDGFIGKSQRGTANQHIQHGSHYSIGKILRHGLHRSLDHSLLRKLGSVPAYNAGYRFPSGLQALSFKTAIHVAALFGKAPHSQGLPAPESLQRQPQ